MRWGISFLSTTEGIPRVHPSYPCPADCPQNDLAIRTLSQGVNIGHGAKRKAARGGDRKHFRKLDGRSGRQVACAQTRASGRVGGRTAGAASDGSRTCPGLPPRTRTSALRALVRQPAAPPGPAVIDGTCLHVSRASRMGCGSRLRLPGCHPSQIRRVSNRKRAGTDGPNKKGPPRKPGRS